ncbi:MAG: polysaccharide deacetylase family protein [Lachnospiraceae bacterium]|nr:polysaccharide deacetylase family protein [Lachnospiraceae bacterium]
MKMRAHGWCFRKQTALFLMVVLLDGMLLGAAGGVFESCWSSHGGDAARYADGTVVQTDTTREEAPKLVALTFDDGPHKTCTPRLLDGLKERNVKVTFFLMGENIAGNEDLVRRIQEEGHLIGNHSYRHIQLTHAGVDAVCEAIEKTEVMIEEITGKRPNYLRPPYGDWNESLECRMDLTTVFWSVDSLDWKLKNTRQIVRRVQQKTGDGDIILMHDIFQTSVDAALQIVDQLQSQGYTFVTVDELLID